MRPEYYADLFRRFATFCRDFGDNKLVRVACGPGGRNPDWTRVLMDRAAGQMQAYSLHFYTVWPELARQDARHRLWRARMVRDAPRMPQIEPRSTKPKKSWTASIPRSEIELFVDEWGAWYRVEPGHPGYGLYQQNSLRDARARRPHVPHLPRAQRPREDGQHRPGGERAAGDDPHRRRQDAAARPPTTSSRCTKSTKTPRGCR